MPRIHLNLADDVLDALDAQRGLASRSAWVGHLIGSPESQALAEVVRIAASPGTLHRHRRDEGRRVGTKMGKPVLAYRCTECGADL